MKHFLLIGNSSDIPAGFISSLESEGNIVLTRTPKEALNIHDLKKFTKIPEVFVIFDPTVLEHFDLLIYSGAIGSKVFLWGRTFNTLPERYQHSLEYAGSCMSFVTIVSKNLSEKIASQKFEVLPKFFEEHCNTSRLGFAIVLDF